MSCVAVVWCVLSIIVAASFWFSLIQPRWFIHNDTMTSLGVYSYCYHDNAGDDVITTAPPGGRPARHVATPGLPATERCQAYGGRRFHFSKLPSTFWQAACILLGSGSVLASVCALMAALTLCLPRRHDSLIAVVTGYVQIIASESQSLSLFHTARHLPDNNYSNNNNKSSFARLSQLRTTPTRNHSSLFLIF